MLKKVHGVLRLFNAFRFGSYRVNKVQNFCRPVNASLISVGAIIGFIKHFSTVPVHTYIYAQKVHEVLRLFDAFRCGSYRVDDVGKTVWFQIPIP